MTLSAITIDAVRSYPPRISKVSKPFWDGLAEGRFSTTQCTRCNKISFPPKSFCPHCWHSGVTWTDAPAQGTLYAFTTVHIAPATFAHEVPYKVCIADLDGRLRIATRLVEARDGVKVGDPVELVVLRYKDGPLFAVRPIRAVKTA